MIDPLVRWSAQFWSAVHRVVVAADVLVTLATLDVDVDHRRQVVVEAAAVMPTVVATVRAPVQTVQTVVGLSRQDAGAVERVVVLVAGAVLLVHVGLDVGVHALPSGVAALGVRRTFLVVDVALDVAVTEAEAGVVDRAVLVVQDGAAAGGEVPVLVVDHGVAVAYGGVVQVDVLTRGHRSVTGVRHGVAVVGLGGRR